MFLGRHNRGISVTTHWASEENSLGGMTSEIRWKGGVFQVWLLYINLSWSLGGTEGLTLHSNLGTQTQVFVEIRDVNSNCSLKEQVPGGVGASCLARLVLGLKLGFTPKLLVCLHLT